MIFHLDLDCFFVSVERVLDPTLRGKPVIVGGPPRSRGVVASPSYEARRYGVRSAMPSAQAARLCPAAVFVRPGHGRYSEYSHRVFAVLEAYSPVVEVASIDEFYLDMAGTGRLLGAPPECAESIRRRLREELELPATIGIASNKLVAKVASKLAKPDGLKVVAPGEEASFLAPLPVSILPGIGPKMQTSLAQRGLHTLGQLASFPVPLLHAVYGKQQGDRLSIRARGVDEAPVVPRREEPSNAQLSHETTFAEDMLDVGQMKRVVAELLEKACYRLRRARLKARRLTLKLRYADFQTVTRSCTVEPTDQDTEFLAPLRALLDRAYTRRVRVRLLGVALSGLGRYAEQEELFEGARRRRLRAVYHTMDRLRERHGAEAVRLAAARYPAPPSESES